MYVHDDVKNCLIDDIAEVRASAGIRQMEGVIVTGDVAFSGKAEEYEKAGAWLDRLTGAIGCKSPDVMVVPGNHDIDRDRLSALGKVQLTEVVRGGGVALDRFLDDEKDREVLYAKFADYRKFAEAYDCGLESDGGVAIDRKVQVAPDRLLRFVGLNSALLCGTKDGDRSLLIGGKQAVLPRRKGEELVVLCHHPLESLLDGEVAGRYIQTRARMHIFGHVHKPSLSVKSPPGNGDLLTLSAGAVVPPETEDGYSYTYNVISFEWDAGTCGLKVSVLPRGWNEEQMRFGPDGVHLGSERQEFKLRCPNFEAVEGASRAEPTCGDGAPERTTTAPQDHRGSSRGKDMGAGADVLRLHFFRDLTAKERVKVLIAVGVLPASWTDDLTHVVETTLWERALETGRQLELGDAIARFRAERTGSKVGREE